MSNVIENLQKAFDDELIKFGVTNSIEVATENIDEPTDVSKPYISGYLLATDFLSADLGVNEQVSTIYQIDVNYTSHRGSSNANKMIDKLRQQFAINTSHHWPITGGDCFTVNSISISNLPVNNGWARKSISLSVSGFTPVL